MARQLKRRISALERKLKMPAPDGPPMVIVCDLDESVEAATMRVCGPKGLPQRSDAAPCPLSSYPVHE